MTDTQPTALSIRTPNHSDLHTSFQFTPTPKPFTPSPHKNLLRKKVPLKLTIHTSHKPQTVHKKRSGDNHSHPIKKEEKF